MSVYAVNGYLCFMHKKSKVFFFLFLFSVFASMRTNARAPGDEIPSFSEICMV